MVVDRKQRPRADVGGLRIDGTQQPAILRPQLDDRLPLASIAAGAGLPLRIALPMAALLSLGREMKQPRFDFRTIPFQSLQQVRRCPGRILVDRMNFHAGFKVGYMAAQAPPGFDPLSPQFVECVHAGTCLFSTFLPIIPRIDRRVPYLMQSRAAAPAATPWGSSHRPKLSARRTFFRPCRGECSRSFTAFSLCARGRCQKSAPCLGRLFDRRGLVAPGLLHPKPARSAGGRIRAAQEHAQERILLCPWIGHTISCGERLEMPDGPSAASDIQASSEQAGAVASQTRKCPHGSHSSR